MDEREYTHMPCYGAFNEGWNISLTALDYKPHFQLVADARNSHYRQELKQAPPKTVSKHDDVIRTTKLKFIRHTHNSTIPGT